MAQAAHAGRMFLLKGQPTEKQWEWFRADHHRTVVLLVDSEAELLRLHEHAQQLGVECHLVIDNGLTEFEGKTPTCLAVGPDEDERVDLVTGESGPLGRLRLA